MVLQDNNYKIIQKVQGTASGVSVLGIGGPFRAIVAKARSEMLRNANLVGRSRAIINETVEVNNKYFVLVGIKTVTVSAYVIEFTGAISMQQQSTQQIDTQPQEIQPQQEQSSTFIEEKPKEPNAYLNFNEFKNGTPSLAFNFQLNWDNTAGTNYSISRVTPRTDTEKINNEIWGIRGNGVDYVNSYLFSGRKGYNKIQGKGYYSFFRRENNWQNMIAHVILPTGKILELTPELLLELCKDNEDIVKQIQGAKLKKNDISKMFEILRLYNLTKE